MSWRVRTLWPVPLPYPVTEVAEFFASAPSREAIAAFRFPPTAHARVRALLARNVAGMLSPEEEGELDQMVVLDDILSLIRSRVQGLPASAQ